MVSNLLRSLQRLYEDRVLPRIIDKVMDNPEMHALRAEVCEGLFGEVVEIGFGSGPNIPFYPAEVTRVQAVDPAELGWDLARERIEASPVPIEFVGLDGQSLPIGDGEADSVLCTWTLCTIPDPLQALAEIRRVRKPGGCLHFVEHGLAHQTKGQTAQRRITPVWKEFAGGCHLDRPVIDLMERAGFTVDARRFATQGPRTVGSMYLGTAVRRLARG